MFITSKALLVGALCGFLCGLATKHFRFLTRSPIQETYFMFLMALMAYYVGEGLGASGVTSLIFCAVLQAQYAWYNLSPQGKHASGVTIATMGFLSEAYVFTIIGLGLEQFATTWWVPWFSLFCFITLFFSRMISVLLTQYLFVWCGARHALDIKETLFFAYQGNIKGALALGFVIKYE